MSEVPGRLQSSQMEKTDAFKAVEKRVEEAIAKLQTLDTPYWNARGDVLKVIISVSSGSIVLAVTISTLRDAPRIEWLKVPLIVSFGLFVFSLIFAFFALWLGTQLHRLQPKMEIKLAREAYEARERSQHIFSSQELSGMGSTEREQATQPPEERFKQAVFSLSMHVLESHHKLVRFTDIFFFASSLCFCLSVSSLAFAGVVRLLKL